MLHRDSFVKTLDHALRELCHVRAGDRLLLAVSGGADSVALLRALAIIADRPHWQLRLHVGHVHHHLRDAADADADFVADLAARLGLDFHLEHIHPVDADGNLESAARRLRYTALQRIAHHADCSAVATAHHADDQLETMLMRLIRGTSVQGLAAMAARRPLDDRTPLIRPMLRSDHAAAVAFLQRLGQGWREDATNTERSRWRARLRADVLPVLRELRPDAAAKAVDTADRLRDAARLVDRHVQDAIAAHVHRTDHRFHLNRPTARDMPPALLRSVLRTLLLDLGVRPDALGRRILEPIVKAARDPDNQPRRFPLPGQAVELHVTAEGVSATRRTG